MSNEDAIVVVTGLPRSGTTMMMRMLEAGGIPLYYDTSRPLVWKEDGRDVINYNRVLRESDKIKDLKDGYGQWLDECRGKAVKILSPTKIIIPMGRKYRFIYMDRKIKHIVNSLKKYEERSQTLKLPERELMLETAREERKKGLRWLKKYPNSRLIVFNFADVVKSPFLVAKLENFLEMDLNIEKMVHVVVKRPAYCLTWMLEDEIYAA
jgi:hypothetical protein